MPFIFHFFQLRYEPYQISMKEIIVRVLTDSLFITVLKLGRVTQTGPL